MSSRDLDVAVAINTREGRFFSASARNLSSGGVGLRNVQVPLRIGEEITLNLTLPGTAESLRVNGVVVWMQENGLAGVQFVAPDASSTQALHSWVTGSSVLRTAEDIFAAADTAEPHCAVEPTLAYL